MEGPKGWREFCRMAGAAILKFETDKNELLEVTIFADRTTSRISVWNISYKCGNRQYTCLLPGNADSEEFEDSILWHMVETANSFHNSSTNNGEYSGLTPYGDCNIIREIASERAIHCGFNGELKWKDFPDEIKALFSYIPEEDNKKLDICEMIKTFIYNQKSWFYIATVVFGLAFLYYCVAFFFS